MKLTRPADVASHEVELQSLISEENADGIGDGSEEVSTPTAKHSKPEKPFRSSLFGIAACALYTFCSVTMVLSNKAISTSVDVEDKNRLPQMSIVMFQCLFAVVLVEFAKFWKVVEYGNFELKTAKQWLPLNVLFVGMLCTGFMSLVYVSVPMVTIFKNITNLFTVFGDWYIFGESISYLTITSVLIMTFGAIFAGIEDLEFNATGYFFMSLNCLCTAGYTLYMKYASSTIKLPKFGMVFYNNLLSIGFLIPLCLLRGEVVTYTDPAIFTPKFVAMNFVAGFIGIFLNFASLWCVQSTSATTYAIVGSVNKVPMILLGFLLFESHMTREGMILVTFATLGGLLHGYSKLPHMNS